MNRLVQDSDAQILIKIAKRAGILRKVEEEKANDRRLAFDQYVLNYLDENNQSREILNDPVVRNVFEQTLIQNFVYKPTSESLDNVEALKTEAYSLLPENIQSERAQSTDCPCVVERIWDKNDETNETRQTFNARKCEAHQDLSIEELHDAQKDERRMRLGVHLHLLENFEDILSERKLGSSGEEYLAFKEDTVFELSWEGRGRDRILKVLVNGKLNTNQKNGVRDWCNNEFGNGKVNLM